jgi:DNA topoisomerase-3
VGPLQGFRSKKGFPFASILKLNAENKLEFDFGQDKDGNGNDAPVDFTGKEPLGKCPKCGSRVFENGMNYVCEQGTGKDRKCEFRTGKIILQQAIEPPQIVKLLSGGRTDLFEKFVSNRTGRAFKAFLVLDKEGKVGFEFPPREAKKGGAARKPKEPPQKIDFTGQESIGKCPKCGGRVFEGPNEFVCENTQAEKKACKFKAGKVILQQAVDRAQITKLLADGKTDLLPHFVSGKTGRAFSAYLVIDENDKVGFEFPPRDESAPASS